MKFKKRSRMESVEDKSRRKKERERESDCGVDCNLSPLELEKQREWKENECDIKSGFWWSLSLTVNKPRSL